MNVEKIESLFSGLMKFYVKGMTELMVNPGGDIWIENNGKVIDTGETLSLEERDYLLRNLAGHYDRVITESTPSLALRLPKTVFNGGRFQGVYPPVTAGPTIVIRVPSGKIFSIHDFVSSGTISENQRNVLSMAVSKKKNILVVGGTGSGKTTLTTTLISLIEGERIVVIEDDPEIVCNASNTVFMETTPDVSIRDLVFYSLRMRPDRIIVGEIRDGKTAVELIQAWLTGHPGGVATVHASTAEGAKNRLYALMKQVHQNPSMEDIDDAIDYVVFIKRQGKKRVVDTLLDAKRNKKIL